MGYKPIFDSQGILLHLGFASGFYGITEFLYFMSDANLKELFKQIMELFDIGDKPGANKKRNDSEKYTANPDKFPKSRRLTEVNNALKPLGWIQLLINNGNEERSSENIESEFITREQPRQPVTKDFTQLRDGDTVDAKVVRQEGINVVVELFCTNLTQTTWKFRYAAGFPKNSILELKISFPNRKNRMQFNLTYYKAIIS